MSNSYFQFKKFRIEQAGAAMKVGTDGVLLGAWVDVQDVESVLDIGTGTGMIALMLAQRSQANVLAVEIEKNAYLQATDNVEQSTWANRIRVKHADVLQISDNAFDLVICNPPFFTNSYKANTIQRSTARHNDSLPFERLMEKVASLLRPNGRFALIVPTDTVPIFNQLAKINLLSPSKIITIWPKKSKISKRTLLEYKKETTQTQIGEITIMESDGSYTDEFVKLVKEFYLNY